ncbi:MAG: RagB/SusD family nutrient uptake outer membrane protein, partial [Chitinophagaceae bacterium]
MQVKNILKGFGAMALLSLAMVSCTNLDQHVYSVIPNANFWKTPAEIAAGVAPAYQALQAIPDGNVNQVNEITSDEVIVPTRGSDWYDNDQWQQMWLHTWPTNHNVINGAWGDIYNGIGTINFTLSVVDNLPTKPANLANIDAELKILRAYYYYLAMDMFGNVPLVTNFHTNPDSVTNSTRQQVFTFVESEILSNINYLPTNVDATTYGRATKYFAYALLAKLYLNAQVYTGTPRWSDCINYCDSIIQSGKYSLQADYFDNFSPQNKSLVSGGENIFVVPFDKVKIGGNNWEMQTLHYQNNVNFGLTGSPWNGFSSNADYYSQFDTNSVYAAKGSEVFRTFLDQRTGQFLIGQQYSAAYPYPPSANVLVSADPSMQLTDVQTGKPLAFTPVMNQLSNPADTFRLAGVRNIKYFPEAGTSGNQSNAMVIFRLADFYLMRAEAEL